MESTHNQAAAKIGFLEKGWLKTGWYFVDIHHFLVCIKKVTNMAATGDSGTIKDGHLMMLGHVNDVISYQGVTVSASSSVIILYH